MFKSILVPIPERQGKLVYMKGYVYFEVARVYDPEKKYNVPSRKIIGKLVEESPGMMMPNENYFELMGDEAAEYEDLPAYSKSNAVKYGAWAIMNKYAKESGIRGWLDKNLGDKDGGLVLDLAIYSVTTGSNVYQHYPSYAENHALSTVDMHAYSDASISVLLRKESLSKASAAFLNWWNESVDRNQRVYISYDSTKKESQAGDIDLVDLGHLKNGSDGLALSMATGYDAKNRKPLFYELYPGSENDVAHLERMLYLADDFGYRNVSFILDRGYFSYKNIKSMEKKEYGFVIMMKGMKPAARAAVGKVRGTFEGKRESYIARHDVYGTSVDMALFRDDAEGSRHFHVYYDEDKIRNARKAVHEIVDTESAKLLKKVGKPYKPTKQVEKYFELFYAKKEDGEGEVLAAYREKRAVIDDELAHCGYFIIITSDQMTAAEAIHLYKGRDCSEKGFANDSTWNGFDCMRVHTEEGMANKAFIGFLALILRSHIHSVISEYKDKTGKEDNNLTVPSAIRLAESGCELKLGTNSYRIARGMTKKARELFSLFGINQVMLNTIGKQAAEVLNRNQVWQPKPERERKVEEEGDDEE